MQTGSGKELIRVPLRRFGKTELAMPVLTAGLMRAKYSWSNIDPGQIPRESQKNLERVIAQALAVGITHLETARAYGTAEVQLGAVLKKYPRKSYILQTKVAPDNDPERFTEAVLDSLSRLGVDYLDLLAIHGLNDYESLWQVCRKNGCLAAARRLQDRGKVRHIGFSGHGPTDVLLRAIGFEDYEGFDYLNLHWYTIFQTHTPVLETAADRDLGVMIISPSDKGGMLHTPPQKLVDLSRPLSPMQFNDLFCLARREIHSLTVGAAVAEDFGEHVRAVMEFGEQRELIGDIYSKWQGAMREATGFERPDAQWNYFPTWSHTPGYVNVPFILWLYNLARGWDLLDYARSRYGQLGRDVRWVPGNNAGDAHQYDFEKVVKNCGMGAEKLRELLNRAHGLLGVNGPQL